MASKVIEEEIDESEDDHHHQGAESGNGFAKRVRLDKSFDRDVSVRSEDDANAYERSFWISAKSSGLRIEWKSPRIERENWIGVFVSTPRLRLAQVVDCLARIETQDRFQDFILVLKPFLWKKRLTPC